MTTPEANERGGDMTTSATATDGRIGSKTSAAQPA